MTLIWFDHEPCRVTTQILALHKSSFSIFDDDSSEVYVGTQHRSETVHNPSFR
jgi:hypothetical protein